MAYVLPDYYHDTNTLGSFKPSVLISILAAESMMSKQQLVLKVVWLKIINMKNFIKVLTVALLMVPAIVKAQDHLQDVIYLKDGSIYKGLIIEQVPNVSFKIQSRDGNVFAVKIGEVEKITKEVKEESYNQRSNRGHGHWKKDSIRYEPKQKGYFFEGQILIENVQGGLRVVNGYKFSKYAYLGVGVGVDFLMSNPFNPKINGLQKKEMAGTYPSLYLYFQSDGPTKGRFTPYLALEGGYAVAFKGKDKEAVDDFGNRLSGGPMGGVGLGFKIQSRRKRAHLSVLFNVNYKQVNYERDQLFLSNSGQVTGYVTMLEKAHLIIPGIRLGFGF